MMAQTTTNKSEAKHIDSTIEILDKHVKDESITGVSNSISAWIKTLSEYDELKSISDDLEKLKSAISEKNGKEIAKLLSALGSATSEAAKSAEDDEAKKITLLGKALTTAGKAVAKIS